MMGARRRVSARSESLAPVPVPARFQPSIFLPAQAWPSSGRWAKALRGLRIEAMGCMHLQIPELRLIRALPPRPFYDAKKAIRALHRDLVSFVSQYHNFGSIGNKTGCSTASQRDLGFLVRYRVLIQVSHRRIGALSGLCNCLLACVNLQSKCQSDDPNLISRIRSSLAASTEPLQLIGEFLINLFATAANERQMA
jgi:hypothetical protein